uniref:Uncharacterized protein n=1 Tax=Candidatus Nitrotoga fabula TaxID=2182327 RepID=A0A2X0QTT3_9PROT|nr:protein of unknown function [Candidatus Nitrotoga fabula]
MSLYAIVIARNASMQDSLQNREGSRPWIYGARFSCNWSGHEE